MINIIIVGSSGHAKVIIDIVEKEKKYKIVGLIDSFRPKGEELLGYKILGIEAEIPALQKKYKIRGGIIGVGDNWIRKNLYEKIAALAPDFEFVKTVHPSAQIARDVSIGKGTVIMAGVCINTSSKIGDFCILNTNSSLDHDCLMEDFSSLAPGATTGGNVKIGKFSSISLGAGIIHKMTIGAHTIIGANALVTKDIGNHKIAYGVPAKEIRDRAEGDKYL